MHAWSSQKVQEPTNRQMMRAVNRRLVLNLVRQHPMISQVQLVERSGLSIGTIVSITRELKQAGLIREMGRACTTVGRRPTPLALCPRARFVLAGLLAPDEFLLAVLDLDGTVLGQREFLVDAGKGAAPLLRRLPREIAQLCETAAVPPQRVAAMGLASHGVVDPQEGNLVFSTHLGWRDAPLRSALEGVLGFPVLVESIAPAITLGEQRWGAARGRDNVLMVEIDSGVGAVCMIDGKLVRGQHHMAGELGQMWMAAGGPGGAMRRLEDVASGKAMAALARAGRGGRRHPGAAPLRLELRRLFADAGRGDRAAQRAIEQAAGLLGLAIANVVNLLDPQIVLLAGAAVDEGRELLCEPIRRHAQAGILSLGQRQVAIEPVQLGPRAAVLGAAARVYDQLFNSTQWLSKVFGLPT